MISDHLDVIISGAATSRWTRTGNNMASSPDRRGPTRGNWEFPNPPLGENRVLKENGCVRRTAPSPDFGISREICEPHPHGSFGHDRQAR
jgi:hypothetical protein